MLEMFAKYMKEEYGKETHYNQYGFCCYKISEVANELFFSDLYINEEYRSTIEAKKFFSKLIEVAKQNNCKMITGMVSIGKDYEENKKKARVLRCYLALKFIPVKFYDNGTAVIRYDI